MKRLITGDLSNPKQQSFQSKVLTNESGLRILQLALKAGHIMPEHASRERVTVVSLRGVVRFTEGDVQTELYGGDVLLLEAGSLHKVEALEDSALLVLATALPGGATPDVLDLRQVERSLRHPLVFKHLDALELQQSVVIVNDHDPIPLLSQIVTARPNEMEWSFLEQGPDFRIRIQRIALPVGVTTGRAS